MNFPSFTKTNGTPIAYVRSVKTTDLPQELRKQAKDFGQVFSVHSSDGVILAIVNDRDRAFTLARMNEFQPVSVH